MPAELGLVFVGDTALVRHQPLHYPTPLLLVVLSYYSA